MEFVLGPGPSRKLPEAPKQNSQTAPVTRRAERHRLQVETGFISWRVSSSGPLTRPGGVKDLTDRTSGPVNVPVLVMVLHALTYLQISFTTEEFLQQLGPRREPSAVSGVQAPPADVKSLWISNHFRRTECVYKEPKFGFSVSLSASFPAYIYQTPRPPFENATRNKSCGS